MKQLAFTLAWVLLVSACSTAPVDDEANRTTTPQRITPNKSVVTLSLEQLADYWLIGDTLKGGDRPRYKRTIEYGCVRVGFGIDSDARLFDVRVLKSNPQAKFSDQALALVSRLEPEATEMNSEKQPMRSEIVLTFANADGEASLVENEAIAKLCR